MLGVVFCTWVVLVGGVLGQKSVNYRIEYGSCGGLTSQPDATNISVSAPYFSTALDVMELAAQQSGEGYQFCATYTEGGAIIDSLNDTESMTPCFWTFYVRSPSGTELRPSESISNYILEHNAELILRYEEFLPLANITTTYAIEFPDTVCTSDTPPDTVTLATPPGSSALDVMEQAIQNYGNSYSLSVKYIGSAGYIIKQLSGEATNVNCSWTAFVTTPAGTETQLAVSVSLYTIPASGYTLTLRYSEPEELTVTTPSSGAVKVEGSYYIATLVLAMLYNIMQ